MFLDDRRLATIKRGAADPLADLDKLNTTRSAGGAEQVLRKLDMAEYFGALSEGGPGEEPEPDTGQRFRLEYREARLGRVRPSKPRKSPR